MNISFEGIGQWCASFACEELAEGSAVKMTGNGKVAQCGNGEAFCGVAVAMGRDGKACSVQLGGFVTLPYSGTAPVIGMGILTGDGQGGVKSGSEGEKRLIVSVDEVAKTVTFKL